MLQRLPSVRVNLHLSGETWGLLATMELVLPNYIKIKLGQRETRPGPVISKAPDAVRQHVSAAASRFSVLLHGS